MGPPVHRPGARNWLGLALAFLVGVFIGGAVMGVLPRRSPSLPKVVLSDEFESIPSPFQFTQWDLEFARDVADLLKNNVYAHLDGLPVLGVTFADDKRTRIESVTVHDSWGRGWVTVNLDKPFVAIDRYEQDYPSPTDEPRFSMRDDGADGIPDYWIHWEVPKSMCPTNTIEWGPCPKKDSESADSE